MGRAVLKDACGKVERPGAEGVWRKAGGGTMWQRPGSRRLSCHPSGVIGERRQIPSERQGEAACSGLCGNLDKVRLVLGT